MSFKEVVTIQPQTFLPTMSTTDALSALRDAIQTRFSISYVTASNKPTTTLSNASSLVLASGLTLPKSSPTRLRKPGQSATDWNISPQEFYTLEAVFLAWHLRDAATGEYMRAVKEAGVPLASMVAITEKSGVVEWLEGRLLDHPNILALQGEKNRLPETKTDYSISNND
jgi:parafibromin